MLRDMYEEKLQAIGAGNMWWAVRMEFKIAEFTREGRLE